MRPFYRLPSALLLLSLRAPLRTPLRTPLHTPLHILLSLLVVSSFSPIHAESIVTTELQNFSAVNVSVEYAMEDLRWNIAVCMAESLVLRRLFFRHPLFAVGSLVPGPIVRLAGSPTGPWERISAGSLTSIAPLPTGEKATSTYGVAAWPIPEHAAIFAFSGEKQTIGGIYLCGDLVGPFAIEFISTVSYAEISNRGDLWLLQSMPGFSPWHSHSLVRGALEGPFGRISLGASVSAARRSPPGLSADISVDMHILGALLSAGVSGASRSYRNLDGKAAMVPLKIFWSLAMDPSGIFKANIKHTVDFCALPLFHTPFIETRERIRLNASLRKGQAVGSVDLDFRIDGDDTGVASYALESAGTIEFGGQWLTLKCSVHGEWIGDGTPSIVVVFPWKVEYSALGAQGKLTLSRDEDLVAGASLGLSLAIQDRAIFQAQVNTAAPIVCSPGHFKSALRSPFDALVISLKWVGKTPAIS